MKIEQVKISDLKLHGKNPKIHSTKQIELIEQSISKFGWTNPIILASDGKTILAGHARLKAAINAGMEEVPVIKTDLSGKEADAYLITDNRLTELGQWDTALLSNILSDIPDNLLEITGFDLGQVETLISGNNIQDIDRFVAGDNQPEAERVEVDAEPQIDRAAELNKIWQVQTGDLWQCGEHRIICGDCTDPAVVERVMMGESCKLLFTSPPYWVGMNYETQQTESDIDKFIKTCVNAWTDNICVDSGRIIINTGTAAIHRIEKKRRVEVLPLIDKWQCHLKNRGWLARHFRIWAKSGGLPASISPRSDVVDQHWEHIVTFENEDYSYIGTFWCPAGTQTGQERVGTPWAQQGVWSDIPGDKSAGGVHVAAFPKEIPTRNIMLYSGTSDQILDPFLGSGTTMIACENTGRKCRGIEISPDYCAVILERFKDATGKEPVQIND